MKYIITLFVCLFLAGCGNKQDTPQLSTTPQISQFKMPFEGSGIYQNLMLPCNCGGIIVYKPDSCDCFTRQYYPDLIDSLNKTQAWFEQQPDGLKLATKLMGKYKSITLDCGCILCVYVPDSCKCLERKYPALAKILKNNYDLANKYKEKE